MLLVHVDIQDCKNAVRDLTKTALLGEMTLVLAWSLAEAARYLGFSFSSFSLSLSSFRLLIFFFSETFKAYEKKGPEMIQQRLSHSPKERAVELLTSIKSVNKTDAANILRLHKKNFSFLFLLFIFSLIITAGHLGL